MGVLEKIIKLHEMSGESDIAFITSIGAKDKNLITNWRKGVTKSYMKYIPQIAKHFNVSLSYFEDNNGGLAEKAPSDSDIKFALFGTTQIDDDVLDEVKRFAKYIKDRKDNGDKEDI